MTNPDDPAFSVFGPLRKDSNGGIPPCGLTKREYFAAMAMQGIHAMYANSRIDISTYSQKACASHAVIMADALIAELSK